jgi:predicted lipoprotein with Yx(FWY)xxD motif
VSPPTQSRAKTRPRSLLSALMVGVGVLALSGCGSSSSTTSSSASTPSTSGSSASSPGYGAGAAAGTAAESPSAGGSAVISTRKVSGLGTVLVNAQGRTLYMFAADKHEKVTCVKGCAGLWPPAKLAAGQKPLASGGAKSSLLGTDPDPEGGEVITYAGWPLYTYAADSEAGSADGQGVSADGGLWYVLSPSGSKITKAPIA